MRFCFACFLILLCGTLLSHTGCRPYEPPALTIMSPQKGIVDTIRFGGDFRYAPFEALNKSGQAEGFNVDLIRAIGEELGAVVTVELIPWNQVVGKIRRRQLDVACFFYTSQRDTFVDYAFYHNVIYHNLVTRKGEYPNLSLETIGGKEVILERNTVITDLFEEKYPTVRITYVASESDALKLLASGKHDCAIVSNYQSHTFIKKSKVHRLVPRGSPILPLEYAFAVPEGSREMLNQLNLAVANLKATGRYSDIYYKHFGYKRNAVEWLRKFGLYVALPLLVVLSLVFLWIWMLRQQVARRTRQLQQQLLIGERIERQLLDQSAVLKKSQQMACLGSWTYAPKTGWATWSEEQFRIFEMSPDQKPPRISELITMIHPQDRFLIAKMVAVANINPRIFNRDFRVNLPSGTQKWLHLTSYPRYDEQGELEELYGTVMDITQRKETEKTLLDKNEALKMANEELDRFVYRCSHDMRAPLASVQGIINVIRLEPMGLREKDYLRMIEESVLRLERFIEDIIDYAANKKTEITSEKLNIKELITDAYRQIRYLNLADQLQLEIDVGACEALYSDRRRIEIILNNLLSNAIKHHDPRKPSPFVKVAVRCLPDQRVSLTVEDNGLGIPAEHIDKVFTMFYRANDRQKGSGLGLYIVRNTVRKLGGTVEINSEVGVGTQVVIYLPIEQTSTATSILTVDKGIPG